jgi:hypothetical protein
MVSGAVSAAEEGGDGDADDQQQDSDGRLRDDDSKAEGMVR